MWFAKGTRVKKNKVPPGIPMLLSRRDAMAGCCGGLALLTEPPAVPYPAGAEPE